MATMKLSPAQQAAQEEKEKAAAAERSSSPTASLSLSFAPLQNDLMIRAARRQTVSRVPVWCMRQAGRYLPEYLAFTEDKEFFTVCRTPRYACEVTLQPLERFPLDAAIIFSDILVIPQAVGCTVEMHKGVGPVFPDPIKDPADWETLKTNLVRTLGVPGLTESKLIEQAADHAGAIVSPHLDYVLKALTLTRHQLNGRVPLIGFCGSPWTLMCYMVEGGGSRLYMHVKRWLYGFPDQSTQLLTLLTAVCAEFLIRQARAGAQMLQVFDSFGGVLSPGQYRKFNLPTLQAIVRRVKAAVDVPVIIFSKEAHFATPWLARETDYDVVSLDWTCDIPKCRDVCTTIGGKAVQGNLDPGALHAPANELRRLVHGMIDNFRREGECIPQGYIANLGHGMFPNHTPQQMKVFVEAVHSYPDKKE